MDDTFTVEVALGGKGRGLDSSVAVPGVQQMELVTRQSH